ncbi:MAG: enolase C-terminal domain-like protein [Dehalococcoidia bacterium]|jgi:L-alanine-DL-glutamate epimerase-like enolase superfamily enzyme
MRISKIECIPVTSKFSQPFPMGGGVELGSASVVLKLHTDEGIVGIADSGGTSAWYRGESQDSMMSLVNNIFAPILFEEDPLNIEKIVARMDHAARDNNQAKSIVDYALHDIKGKALGVPVYQLLGGLTTEKIPLGYVLPGAETEIVLSMAKQAVKAGFRVLKLKVGAGDEALDIANVKALRELGDDIEIFIDANGGWHYYQALMTLRKLEPYNISMAEQPVPWWDIEGMARLRSKTSIPVFADEAAIELKNLMEIIQKNAADGFFLKIPKAGGLLKAQKWVTVAKAAGLPVVCGCMMGSGLEAATYTHLLVADEWLSKMVHENLGPLHIHDVFETVSHKISNDVAKEVPRYENGFLYPTTAPGLGVELNEPAIAGLMTEGKTPTTLD